MVDGINEIVWTKRSLKNLQMIFDYISKDSLQNANKVINDIVKSMEKGSNQCLYL
jgi:plasmid stabilization system protein ParE